MIFDMKEKPCAYVKVFELHDCGLAVEKFKSNYTQQAVK